jgi:hypothetical protein
MGLAGPKAEAPEPPPSPAVHPKPSEQKHEPPPRPKFGTGIFKELDRTGGS